MFDIEKFISSLNTKYLQHECCMGYSGKLESKARVSNLLRHKRECCKCVGGTL